MTGSTPAQLLYLSPVPLGSFAQRPHHFVLWFHQRFGGDVMWIDPGPSRLPRGSDWPRLLKYVQPQGTPLGPVWRDAAWLHHAAAKVLPVEPCAAGRWLNAQFWRRLLERTDAFVTPDTVLVLGKPCALSLALVERYPANRCIFDAMDHMPGFCSGISRRWMVRAEQMLAQEADAIWASSHALAEHHRRHAGKLSLVLNGLTQPPPFHAQRKASRPVLGYLGVMDRWFDWERVIALARAYPQAIFQLVGPVHTGPAGPLPANIECLPPVPQHQVYDTLARFQVGMIPFVCNDVTDYVDPVKYYEYRAMGLPVLSTRFGEMNHRHAQDGVHFWDALETGKLTLQALIDAGLDASQQRHFCEENTWQKRFDAVSESLSGPL